MTMDNIDTDPLADTDPLELPPEPLATAVSDGAAPADDAGGTSASSPQAGPVTTPLSVTDAQRAVHESHLRNARATDQQRECRGRVAFALAAFQRATMQTTTFEQLAREHINSENQLRADRAAGKIPQRGGQRRLGSAVDAFAYHTRNSGRGAGGGAAFRRGATTRRGVSDLKAFPGSGLPQIKE